MRSVLRLVLLAALVFAALGCQRRLLIENTDEASARSGGGHAIPVGGSLRIAMAGVRSGGMSTEGFACDGDDDDVALTADDPSRIAIREDGQGSIWVGGMGVDTTAFLLTGTAPGPVTIHARCYDLESSFSVVVVPYE